MKDEVAAALFMARVSPKLNTHEWAAAYNDGWIINFIGFPSSAAASPRRFPNDEAARRHIMDQAIAGSWLHLRALAILHVHNEAWRCVCEVNHPEIIRLFSQTS